MSDSSKSPLRTYQAACPGCGAPVHFVSAQSTHAVCGYCQSTVVRNGEVLSRLGKMAEVFNDHSLLQLQVSGIYQNQPFTLLGRLQYQYGEGTWVEWHAVLQDGSSAFLCEDNGAYVFTKTIATQRTMPPPERLALGTPSTINGKSFTVSSNQPVQLLAAQGELPHLPELGASHSMVELRSAEGEVLSIDYGTSPPRICLGKAVSLDALSLKGLRDELSKEEKGRQFDCPHCGAPVTVQLATSKSLTCSACSSIIDISQGVGGELKHAAQDEPMEPLIKLGSTGTFQGATWQVVGYQHRMGTDPVYPDESFGWEEYLLYNAKRGFTFLVDSVEGWSLVKPATGAPTLSNDQKSANYLGTHYLLKESYTATTNYVAGEFYWQVQRGQKTTNRDYALSNSLLSMEQSPSELTWSVGSKLNSDTVAKMFKLEDKKELLSRSDAHPLASSSDAPWQLYVFIGFMLLVIFLVMSRNDCDPNVENCTTSRTSGGSFGGYTSGGGHK